MVGGGKNESPAVWVYQGGQFVKISTIVIDSVLTDYSTAVLDQTYTISWASKGQYFVAFTFSDRTFVYNMTTNLWHEQKSTLLNDAGVPTTGRWRAASLVNAYGYNIVGDIQDGRIGILSPDTYQEYEIDIIRVFTTMPIANKGNRIRVPAIELTMEAGVGNGIFNPAVSMAISEDSKRFDYERTRRIGKVGRFKHRAIWRKNGRIPRFAVLKFRLSDPVKPVVIKLEADIV